MTCHHVRAALTAYPRLAQVTLHSAPAQLHGGSRARLALHVYAPSVTYRRVLACNLACTFAAVHTSSYW